MEDGIRLWRCDTWQSVAHIEEPMTYWFGNLAFHPTKPLLAVDSQDRIHVWSLNVDLLLRAEPSSQSVLYTTAKVVFLRSTP
jgi:hypothetical protein